MLQSFSKTEQLTKIIAVRHNIILQREPEANRPVLDDVWDNIMKKVLKNQLNWKKK